MTIANEEEEGKCELDETIIQMQGILADKLLPPFNM
jgi:hypothetical protein